MEPETIRLKIDENDLFPNNDRLPLLVYKGVFSDASADRITSVFLKNRWHGLWRNGIFSFQ